MTETRLYPYWWDRTPRPVFDRLDPPTNVDVAVIGSGYTGLHAALVAARSGRSVAVFDSADAGFGCSTRNGGQISTSIKPGLADLVRRYGKETGLQIAQEGHNALAWITQFIHEENLHCDFKVPGRFHAAHSPKAFDRLVSQLRNQPAALAVPYRIVDRSEQHLELGTEAYHGGVVYENHASVDPARYHQGLLQLVISAGATIHTHCKVEKFHRQASGFRLNTVRGSLQCRDLVLATNGYTGPEAPWQRRRVIPIGSYIIATDVIEPSLMNQLMPTQRILSDTRKVVYYYRPSPDHTRILFGGRVSSNETDPRRSAPLLKRDLDALFPALKDIGISHSWMGFVAYTFDTVAHAGEQDGVYYAMGYCGSGVSMASYLGMRIGQQLTGDAAGNTGLASIDFPTRPLYRGKPWFLAPMVACYRLRDRLNL